MGVWTPFKHMPVVRAAKQRRAALASRAVSRMAGIKAKLAQGHPLTAKEQDLVDHAGPQTRQWLGMEESRG